MIQAGDQAPFSLLALLVLDLLFSNSQSFYKSQPRVAHVRTREGDGPANQTLGSAALKERPNRANSHF